ncbi:hypothetical protein MKEN_00622400 [Mycena kentingensis (nom. inval.)]|nr:hypothetical protein MKEN_00622400 [Mycena kentingensis (nom. inval.)]
MAYCKCPSCARSIPDALLCRGTIHPEHKGLWYRRCPSCEYFAWIPPPNAPAGSQEASNPDAIVSPLFPPPPPTLTYTDLNIDLNLPLPPHDMSFDPLAGSSFSASSPPPPPPSQVSPATAVTVNSRDSKRQCSVTGCARLVSSAKCTTARCKQCCMKLGTCGYAKHRDSTVITASNGNPSALARPPAVVPIQPPQLRLPSTSQLSVDDLDLDNLPPKLYRQPMDDAFAAQYKAGIARQQEQRVKDDEKKVQARRALHQLRVCYWFEKGKEPKKLREQDLPHFPHVNLSLCPRLLAKMDLKPDDMFWCYDYKGGIWDYEDVDATITIRNDQTLLVRHANLESADCLRLDEMIRLHAPIGGVTGKRKAPQREFQPSPRPRQQPRALSPSPPPPSQPTTRPARSPSPSTPAMSSRSVSLPSSTIFVISDNEDSDSDDIVIVQQPPAPAPAAVDDGDDLWKEGRVMVRPNCGKWPGGVYARDMAFAFKEIGSGRNDKEIEERFAAVFPGVSYVQSTFYRQRSFWQKSTQEERDAGERMARTKDGDWVVWRRKLSGHVAFMSKSGGGKRVKQEEV